MRYYLSIIIILLTACQSSIRTVSTKDVIQKQSDWQSEIDSSSKDNKAPEIIGVNKRISADEGYLTFTFSKEMQRLSTETIEYSITPRLPCEWYWSDPLNLDCFLIEGSEFKPATEYLLEIKRGLYSKDGKELKPYSLKFETERPKIQTLTVKWLEPTRPEIHIYFNFGIIPVTIKENYFLVNDKGEKVPLKTHAGDDSNHYFPIESWRENSSWILRPEGKLKASTNYSLFQEREIISPFGKLPTKKGLVKKWIDKIQTFGNFDYLGYECLQNYKCNSNQDIAIKFTSEISRKEINSCKVSLEKQGFRLSEYRHYSDRIIVEPNFARESKRLKCLEEISDIFGRKLSEDTKINIAIMDYEPLQENNYENEVLTINDSIQLEHRTINYNSIDVEIDEIDFNKVKSTEDYRGRSIHIDNKKNKIMLTNLLPDGIVINSSIKGRVFHGKYIWRDQHFFIQKTKYNIIIHGQNEKSLIFISDIYSNKPISNIEFTIELVNQEKDGAAEVSPITAKTDVNGIAIINNLLALGRFYQEQHWILKFSDGTKVLINRGHEISSPKSPSLDYRERDDASKVFWGITNKPLYRPGEMVRYAGFLRKVNGNNIGTISLPKNPIIYVFANHMECYGNSQCESFHIVKDVKQDEFGKISGEFKLPKLIKDGRYSISLDDDNFSNDILNEVYFEVANFKSQKLKVTSQSNITGIHTKEKIKITTQAEYYSGGQYGGVNSEIALSLEEIPFAPKIKNGSDYIFEPNDNLTSDDYSETYYFDGGKLDSKGLVVTDISIPITYVNYGKIKYRSSILTDEGEKILSRLETSSFSRKDYFVGIKKLDWWLKTNESIAIDALVVDINGVEKKDVNVKYFIQKVKDLWLSSRSKENEPLIPIQCKNQGISNNSIGNYCKFIQLQSGAFRIFSEITYPDGSSQKSSSTHFFQNDKNDESSDLVIQSSSKTLSVGEIGKVSLSHGLKNASALIVIHRSNIIDYWWQPLKDGKNDIEFKIKEAYSPGFDVSIFVNYGNLEKHKALDSPNYAQVITERIKVNKPIKLPVVEIISSPRDSAPGDRIKIRLKNNRETSSSVILAIIDESILNQVEDKDYYQIKKSSLGNGDLTWDDAEMYELSSKLYSSRYQESIFESDEEKIIVTGSRLARVDIALMDSGVSTILSRSSFNSFGSFRERKEKPKTIGSTTSNLSNIRSLFKDAAYWNKDINISGSSSKTIEVKLPDNLTTWKVIAISTVKSGDIFVDEEKITTSKDLEVHAEMPSQLTKGDTFKFQAEVISKSKDIDLITLSSSAQTIPGKILLSEKSIVFTKIFPFARNKLSMRIATKNTGNMEVLTVADSISLTDAILQTTPIYPTSLPRRVSYYSILPDESHVHIERPQNSISDTAKLSFSLSGSILSNLQGTFDYMQVYPHQCWEQKLSRAVVAKVNIDNGNNNIQQGNILNSQIQDAVDSIYSFQALNGGMSFFGKNEDSVSPYLSAYTYKMIKVLNSKEMMFPDSSTDSLERYLINLFNSRDSKMTLELAAVIINALAMDSRNDKIVTQYLPNLLDAYSELDAFSQSQILEVSTKYPNLKEHTSNISKAIVNMTRYTDKKRLFVNAKLLPWYFHNYDAKKYCATISSLVASKADKKTIYQFVNGLLDLRRKDKGDFGNTMSNAYCSLALSEYASSYENKDFQLKYKLSIGSESFTLNKRNKNKTKKVSIQKPIEIDIEAIKSGAAYLRTTLQYMFDGMKAAPVANGFSLQRKYFVRENNHWVLATTINIKQGSYIKVQLKINNPLFRRLVAITDTLPGTFFALDEKLTTSAPTQLFEGLNSDYYFNEKQFTARNVKFYADILPAGNHIIEYLVRVTHQGEFSALSAKIEDMYDDDVFATSAPEVVVVH